MALDPSPQFRRPSRKRKLPTRFEQHIPSSFCQKRLKPRKEAKSATVSEQRREADNETDDDAKRGHIVENDWVDCDDRANDGDNDSTEGPRDGEHGDGGNSDKENDGDESRGGNNADRMEDYDDRNNENESDDDFNDNGDDDGKNDDNYDSDANDGDGDGTDYYEDGDGNADNDANGDDGDDDDDDDKGDGSDDGDEDDGHIRGNRPLALSPSDRDSARGNAARDRNNHDGDGDHRIEGTVLRRSGGRLPGEEYEGPERLRLTRDHITRYTKKSAQVVIRYSVSTAMECPSEDRRCRKLFNIGKWGRIGCGSTICVHCGVKRAGDGEGAGNGFMGKEDLIRHINTAQCRKNRGVAIQRRSIRDFMGVSICYKIDNPSHVVYKMARGRERQKCYNCYICKKVIGYRSRFQHHMNANHEREEARSTAATVNVEE